MTRPIISGPYRTFRALKEDETFIEYEGSTITIPMRGRQSPDSDWMEEEVKLRAFMRLEVFPAYINQLGTREFQFIIRDWELYGKSEMLNRLYYGDPRGRLLENGERGFADYVPAVLTFNVSHNYYMGADAGHDIDVKDIFGDPRSIELRNLTSHHLRTWAPGSAGREAAQYGQPHNTLYWQIVMPNALRGADLQYLLGSNYAPFAEREGDANPLLIFHKKTPGIPGEGDAFDISNPRDRARYLLAVSTFDPLPQRGAGAQPMSRATLPGRGFNANLVQQPGNSVLSALHRYRLPLDVRFGLNSNMRSPADVGEYVGKRLADGKRSTLSGWLKLVDPSKSKGTAEQGPQIGEPVDSADFPADITYAINYDVWVNDQKIVDDQAGIAEARGALEIPPRDVKVAFEKPTISAVAGRYLEFRPGSCTGMMEIAQREFEDGANFARYWRTVPLDLGAPAAPAVASFDDYDPSFHY
ncbi:hypothetical protein [Mesorhizobium sp. L-8-3]|uniref:hypothetical protein n=1 Tax=Mesorhizobium sp. L-8-3 TaxID=2744522 RepID=UPI0019288791|nr:hypothetical protein [Mesorhizobium sp. L-8-3]